MSIALSPDLSPAVAQSIEAVFAAQGLMNAWDMRITALGVGTCEMEMAMSPAVRQQHGYFHGGAIGAMADNVGGAAAYTVLAPARECLSVEYKINFMSPGDGELLRGRGKVLKAGRTLVVTTAEIFVVRAGVEKLCAIMQQTLAAIEAR